MRRPRQYVIAAIIGALIGAFVTESEMLIGALIGAGIGMVFVLFCHIYPRVGYAEHKSPRP